MKHFTALLFLICASPVFAEVTAKGEHGFNLRIETEVKVRPADAYAQFLRVSEWWQKSHTWFGDANNLSIEPKAGGCFCEKQEDKEVLHMLVTFVNPGAELKMVGGLGPLQMMGLHGGMSWRFEPIEGGTKIVQTYNVTGYAQGGLIDLADIVDAVQTGQQQSLTDLLNR